MSITAYSTPLAVQIAAKSLPPLSQLLLPALLLTAIAYLCGCFNGAVIVSKYILHDDVRKHGSGNAGLTNFYRTFGGPLTFVVILTDMLKAVAALLTAVFIARYWGGDTWQGNIWIELYAKYWAGSFCLLGHMFPCMFHFKGGKGILSGGTVVLLLNWRVALLAWGVFLVLAVLTRYVSLGSCCAGAMFPVGTWLFYHDLGLTLIAAMIGGLVVYMHRSNLKRLLSGQESKFSFRRN